MLHKQYRLRLKKDFQNVFQSKKSLKSSCLLIKYTSNGLTNPRIAFVVSNKVNKLATKRNYIKRVLRNISKEHISLLPNIDMVIIALKEINTKTYIQIKQELDTLLNKIK